MAASFSSNRSHFFSDLLQSSPESLNFIHFHYVAIHVFALNCDFAQLEMSVGILKLCVFMFVNMMCKNLILKIYISSP